MAKVAWITGAGSGIGRTLALEFARAGYDVAVHYCGSVQGALQVKQEISALNRRCIAVQADLSHVEQLREAFRRTCNELGTPDVFVSNAGLTLKATIEDMTEQDFDLLCSVDFKACFFGLQEAVRCMKARGGSILLISSNNAFLQHPMCACYGAVKAAMLKLCRSAAMEMGKYGIRVNAIAPGWTDTGASRLGRKEDSFYHIPLRRWCTPQEIAQAALFLCGPWAGSITGSCLVMDGGASLQTEPLEKYGYAAEQE
ncbi:MAG: SDR family NAD(P)-dependent oxidoreductase [Eubacteriales bacterium]|nr:SDR family NAD(P)-dependent oxidoreductase [Eubacteriales bacterium]